MTRVSITKMAVVVILGMTAIPVSAQTTGTLSPGQSYSGTLHRTDPATDDGRHIQCFNLDLTANQEVTLTLISSHFDTFLFAGQGRCAGQLQLNLSNDDFESGSTDSQLRFVATQSDYALVVTSSRASETGGFLLSVEGPAGSDNELFHVGTINRDGLHIGSFSSNNVQVEDYYWQCVELNVQPGQPTRVSLLASSPQPLISFGYGRCRMDSFVMMILGDNTQFYSWGIVTELVPEQNEYVAIIMAQTNEVPASYILTMTED